MFSGGFLGSPKRKKGVLNNLMAFLNTRKLRNFLEIIKK